MRKMTRLVFVSTLGLVTPLPVAPAQANEGTCPAGWNRRSMQEMPGHDPSGMKAADKNGNGYVCHDSGGRNVQDDVDND